MVGVPGRSKGCNTCIQRKIRCDQETPECGNCRKSNRLCAGYKRKVGYVFSHDVHIAAPDHPRGEDATNAVVHQGRWRRSNKPRQPSSKQPDICVATNQPGKYEAARMHAMWAGIAASPPRAMSAGTAWRQQFHSLFLTRYLPLEMLHTADRGSSIMSATNWLVELQGFQIHSPALHASIAAFSTARLGRFHGDDNLVCQGRSIYNSALVRLRQALADPRTRLSDETVAACMALSLYELTESPKDVKSAFMTHQRGALMLLEMRGPDSCTTSSLGHNVFLALRAQAIAASLVTRQETFLSRPEWIEIPWRSSPKSSFDELIDRLFDFPSILRQFDDLAREARTAQDSTTLRDGLQRIVAQCQGIESALLELYGKFEATVAGPIFWPELSTIQSPADDDEAGKVFPVSFHFPASLVAHVLTTYWSTVMAVHYQLMCAHSGLAMVDASLATGTGEVECSHARRAREHREKWIAMVRNICQSVEYLTRDSAGEFGSFALLPSLGGCIRVLREGAGGECRREERWMVDVLVGIKRRLNLPENNVMED